MEIGLQLRGDYLEVLRSARWAEARGLAAFALPDHYLGGEDASVPAWDHVVHLAGLARETERIELVDLLSPVTFRHPAVHAKMAVTIADMAARNGQKRFVMGLGTGWLASEHELFGFDFPDLTARYRLLAEQLEYLNALREEKEFAGEHYQLEAFPSRPRFEVPLLVGGSGSKRTPELAGRYANEYNLFSNLQGDLAQRIARCRSAAQAAGRDPSAVRLSFTATPVAGKDQKTYQKVLSDTAAEYQRQPGELEERLKLREMPIGTPDQIAARLNELAGLGISRIYLQAGTSDVDQLETRIQPYLT